MFSLLSLFLTIGCGSSEKETDDTAATNEDTGSDESSGSEGGSGTGTGSEGETGEDTGSGSDTGTEETDTGTEETDTGEGASDFVGEVDEGDWLDEAPTIESDNCGFAIDAEIFMTVSDSTESSFTITMDKENGSEEDTAFYAITMCEFTPDGVTTCPDHQYLSMPFDEFFADDPEMTGMEGTMNGSLEISGTFTTSNTFEGTMSNTFMCQGGDCAMLQSEIPFPCVTEKSFTVVYSEGEEAE